MIEVQKEVKKILEDKLVVMCGSTHDEYVLDLLEEEFDIFDLHTHYRTTELNQHLVVESKPVGLKDWPKEFSKLTFKQENTLLQRMLE